MNSTTTQKLYTCKIDNRWMWSLENACITVVSPTGGYVRIDKWHMDGASDELRKLVWRIYDAGKTIDLTVEEMKLLTTYPKASVYRKRKKSQ